MANTTKTRAELKAYFKKYSSPTVQQWHDVLDGVLNLVDDLPLNAEDVENLNATIKELKTSIAKKADQAEGCTGYVPHLTELKDDDANPVGTIAQYIGATDYDRDLIRGFFYEKQETTGNTTVEAAQRSIQNFYTTYNIDGERYFGEFNVDSDRAKAPHFMAMFTASYNTVIAIKVSALKEQPAQADTFKFGVTNDAVWLPLIGISKDGELTDDITTDGCNCYICGEEIMQSGVKTSIIYRETDKQAFVLVEKNGGKVVFSVICPAFIEPDGAYTVEWLESELKIDLTHSTSEGNGTFTFTPLYFSGEKLVKWQIIQTSPAML